MVQGVDGYEIDQLDFSNLYVLWLKSCRKLEGYDSSKPVHLP